MTNRFQQYISNGYNPQFIPTPLDGNLMYNALGQRQANFNNALNGVQGFIPDISYYKGDRDIAQNIYQEIESNKNNIVESIFKDGDVNKGARELMKLKQDYQKRRTTGDIAQLAASKNEFEQGLEQIKKIRSVDDYQRALSYYNKNVHTPFEIGRRLNSPVLLDDPGLGKAALEIGKAIKADGIPLGDGRLRQSPDGAFTKVYVNGKTEKIDPNEAFGIIRNYMLTNPETEDYINKRNLLGDPVDLNNLTASVANAVSYQDTDLTYGFRDDAFGMKQYEDGARPFTMSPGNGVKLADGTDIKTLDSDIKNATGVNKTIMEAFKREAIKKLNDSDLGKSLQLTQQELNDYRNGLKLTISNAIPNIQNNIENLKNDKTPILLGGLSQSEKNSKINEYQNLLKELNNNYKNIETYNQAELYNINTNYFSQNSINPNIESKLNLYNKELNNILSDNFTLESTEILPRHTGKAKTAYNEHLLNALNTNNFEVVSGFNLTNNQNLDESMNSKTSQEIFNRIKAGSDLELVSVSSFSDPALPPLFTIRVSQGTGANKQTNEYQISPKTNPQVDGNYSLPSTVQSLIDDLDVTNNFTNTQVEQKLSNDRIYNDIGLFDINNPNLNLYSDTKVKNENVTINGVYPYANESSNGTPGMFININDSNTGKNEMTSVDLETIVTMANDLGIYLDQDPLYKMVYEKYKDTPNTPIDFTDLTQIDPKIREHFTLNYINSYLQK